MNDYDHVNLSRSTVFKQSRRESIEFLGKLEHKDNQEIKEQEIGYSDVYCYDEQYVFINNELYYRLALIDANTKQIVNDIIYTTKDFNNQTIENFLKTSLEGLPLKTIVTDGKNNYPDIISAINAIQQRCIFHVIKTLMDKLQKKVNTLEKQTKSKNNQIEKNKAKNKRTKKTKTRKQKQTPKPRKRIYKNENN